MNDKNRGQLTEDLRQIQQTAAHLPADELSIQRFGHRSLVTGLAICAAVVVGTFIAWILADNLFTDPDSALFGVLIFAGGTATGTSLALIGGLERQGRPVRAQQRHIQIEFDRVRSRVDGLIADTNERLDMVMDLLLPISDRLTEFAERVDTGGKEYLERLAHIEEVIAQVPTYTDAVIQGIELRRSVVGRDGM